MRRISLLIAAFLLAFILSTLSVACWDYYTTDWTTRIERVDTVVVRDTIVFTPTQWRDSLVVEEVRRLNELAQQQLIDPRLMLAVSRVENRGAVPDAISSAGAIGLMQVMPLWRGTFASQCGDLGLFDPRTNVCYGVRIFLYHWLRCDKQLECSLADYNGAVTPSKRVLYNNQVVAALETL